MDGYEGARRQHRPLDAFLPAFLQKGTKVREVAKLRPVDRRLGARWQPVADLRDHDADLARFKQVEYLDDGCGIDLFR